MSLRVLIVDDSKLARMVVIKAIKARYPDWVQVEAANADDALRSMQKDLADVAIVDYHMPGRSGIELGRELLALKPELPIAVISANYQEEVVSAARALGATFLPKPLKEDALNQFLDAASERAGQARGP